MKQNKRETKRKSTDKNKKQAEHTLTTMVEADKFRIELKLKENVLTIDLDDYTDWIKYSRQYTAEDIGKDINPKVELEDIFYSFVENEEKEASEKQENLIIAKQGSLVRVNDSSSFKVEKHGKVTVTIKIFYQRGANRVERMETSVLNLGKVSEIREQDRVEITHELEKRAIREKYEKEIEQLAEENKKLKEELKTLKKQNEPKQIELRVKTMTGSTSNVTISSNATVLQLKRKMFFLDGVPADQLRLIFAGRQLVDDKRLSDYNIQNQSTIHSVLNLRGDIGIFDEHLHCLGRQFLTEPSFNPNSQQINRLIEELKGEPKSTVYQTELQGYGQQLAALKKLADEAYWWKLSDGASRQEIEDLKISLSESDLEKLVGAELCQKLGRVFTGRCDEIVVRRCEAHGKLINFHTDVSLRTLQVSLNDDSQYVGGRLVFASQGGLQAPKRTAGTVTLHNNRIVHGVTQLKSGVRYGLFFLQK